MTTYAAGKRRRLLYKHSCSRGAIEVIYSSKAETNIKNTRDLYKLICETHRVVHCGNRTVGNDEVTA